MSQATGEYHYPKLAEQPTLLSQKELTELRCPPASRPRKGEIAAHSAHHHDVEERFTQSSGATQPKLPGI